MSIRLLITGGAGFVGSHLAVLFKQQYPAYTVKVLDNLKRRGSELNLRRLREADVQFIHGDIRNKEDLWSVGPVDVVIDAAAEPSVMAGLDAETDYLINTNLIGTLNTLQYADSHRASMIFLSTSRVYPFHTLDESGFEEKTTRFSFTDQQVVTGVCSNGISTAFPLHGPRSFYGATKLASELMITEYAEFRNMKTVINRCGVITGPWQMGKIDQGVVVLWMSRHLWNRPLTYNGYGGKGKQVRDILHFRDLFRLIDWEVHHMEKVRGMTFNVGGGNRCSISLQELTAICEQLTGNRIPIASTPENRKADVRIYVTDNSEVNRITGWQPTYTPERILSEIHEWIRANEGELKLILNN